MATGVVSKSGDGLMVHLPASVDLAVGEVEVVQRDEGIMLTPKKKLIDVDRLIELLRSLPDEMFEAIEEARRQDRERGL